MKRAELIQIVERVSDACPLPEGGREKVIATVSNPSVSRVVRGGCQRGPDRCPMVLAGLIDLADDSPDSRPWAWAYHFDDETAASPLTMVIEVED